MTETFEGQLEVDFDRGVIYFHSAGPSSARAPTLLRICQLQELPKFGEHTVDITVLKGFISGHNFAKRVQSPLEGEDAEEAANDMELGPDINKNSAAEDMPTFKFRELTTADSVTIVDLLVATKLVSGRSEALFLIRRSRVKLNGNYVVNKDGLVDSPEKEYIIQAGGRIFVRIVP